MSVTVTESGGVGCDESYFKNSGVCEIEEEINSTELFEINDGLPFGFESKKTLRGVCSQWMFMVEDHQDSVYVAVGKSESSMYALSWTLQHLVNPSTIIYLIHVFPEIKHVPSPFKLVHLSLTVKQYSWSNFGLSRSLIEIVHRVGRLPKSQVSPEQVETYMAQERGKRREPSAEIL
ncbi:hypothetical protein Patl1_09609 [Pistacia atlantica]|uniref:Uncharacterized protein n=1 Tax=Pistacia atlantica TaxID=434234 RepID=A0ACC1A392_9ROSI|nr:hypothetical protein Patl1_09609 [Pistacia atlantica]